MHALKKSCYVSTCLNFDHQVLCEILCKNLIPFCAFSGNASIKIDTVSNGTVCSPVKAKWSCISVTAYIWVISLWQGANIGPMTMLNWFMTIFLRQPSTNRPLNMRRELFLIIQSSWPTRLFWPSLRWVITVYYMLKKCILCFDFLGFFIDFLNFRFPFHYFSGKKWKLASILKIFQS